MKYCILTTAEDMNPVIVNWDNVNFCEWQGAMTYISFGSGPEEFINVLEKPEEIILQVKRPTHSEGEFVL